MPGDVILTGTPSGVQQLKTKDQIQLNFLGHYRFSSWVE
jgi:2-keto-4-pentenoate hydratase/2-oxohepta-3-ene-1,7-dioic acid hydratase in catechol pathway